MEKPSDKCLDFHSYWWKYCKIKHFTIFIYRTRHLFIIIWLLLVFSSMCKCIQSNKIVHRERKNVIYLDMYMCKVVFDRWCVKLMMRNARAQNMPFLFFSFFFSLSFFLPFFPFFALVAFREWPCLIDWSPESTIDRHIQSSTQTDDGRQEKKRKRRRRKEKYREISWTI